MSEQADAGICITEVNPQTNTKVRNVNESLKKNFHVFNASMATWLIENYHDELKKGRAELYKALDKKISIK